jgi:hypothetical protein
MKISKEIIFNSFNKLTESTTNKFWGLLAILKVINEKQDTIVSNVTYEIETSKISDILDSWFYFGQSKKNYHDNNIYLRFSNNWIDVFNKIASKEKPNILDVAIFYFKDEDFKEINSTNLVNLFKKNLNLPEHFLTSNFNMNFLDFKIELEENYTKKVFLDYFKMSKSINLNYETLSFSNPYLIVSKPSELKRAPFIQTLYSGTEIMELLLIADFDFDKYYFSNEYNNLNQKSDFILGNKVLYKVIFESFKYICDLYGESKVLDGFDEKDSKIEDRTYRGIALKKYFGFETIIGIFQNDQNTEKLKSSKTSRFIDEKITVLDNEFSYFTNQWNSVENGRGLTLVNFNNLLKDISDNNLEIINDKGFFKLIQKTNLKAVSPLKETKQIIYYGAPGTGKSYKVDNEIKSLSPIFYDRITFHPEFDHTSFIGGYKPVSAKDINGNDIIKYQFVSQAFTNIYYRAWSDLNNQYYLVIEEINRGNCAEIFGDIFQLLDRNSNYTVSPSDELKTHLIEKFGDKNHDGIVKGLRFPSNLSILATMNTSDQSLFPMDSAFKRRWDWEYIPICYDDIPENESYSYNVIIDDTHSFKWIDFIKNVNTVIKTNPNLGMDKCIGNYFIKSDSKEITLKEFVNKAIFYLWNDVFKDEDSSDSIFGKGTSYEDFFPIDTNGKKEVEKILDSLNINTPVKVKL